MVSGKLDRDKVIEHKTDDAVPASVLSYQGTRQKKKKIFTLHRKRRYTRTDYGCVHHSVTHAAYGNDI